MSMKSPDPQIQEAVQRYVQSTLGSEYESVVPQLTMTLDQSPDQAQQFLQAEPASQSRILLQEILRDRMEAEQQL